MSIKSEITRLMNAKAELIVEIKAKGVTVPANASLEDLAALVSAIDTELKVTDDGNGNVTVEGVQGNIIIGN